MRPDYEKILEKPERSFIAKTVIREKRPTLSDAWHYHPEIEICYTEKSRGGKLFVGNQVRHYEESDIVMLGSNLPHGFVTSYPCRQVVLQMNSDFLGSEFIEKPELKSIKQLFHSANRGLFFNGRTRNRAVKKIKDVIQSVGFGQLVNLLELLNMLANSPDATSICTKEYILDDNESSFDRMKVVYDHIMNNFKEEVVIREVSEKLSLSEPAFFAFIKKHTKKTFTQLINEYRVNHACKLLMSNDMTISQIAFDSGFNSLSYFNRKFKQVMNQTPHDFREAHLGIVEGE